MDRVLRFLLLLYPPSFRRRYGRELLEQLRHDLAEAKGAGLPLLAWTRHLAGFVLAGLLERASVLGGIGSRASRPAGLGRILEGDVRFAWRGLRRRPGFASAAISILALGVAANVGVFSMARATLYPRLAEVRDPRRLVSLFQYSTEHEYHSGVSLPAFLDYGTALHSLESFAGFSSTPVNLIRADESVRLQAQMVSTNYFQVLDVQPRLGRGFVQNDPGDGERRSVVLSHTAWRTYFGADPDVLSRSIRLGGTSFTVVGVAPPGFRGLELETPADLWVTLDARDVVTSYPEDMVQGRGMHWLTTVGRLRHGATLEQVRQEAAATAASLADTHSDTQKGWEARVLPLTEAVIWPGERERIRRVALMLSSVVGLFLLLSCVTLANMALADVLARQQESAVRLALGAGRAHLVRHELLRALLVTVPGVGLGLLGGAAVVRGAVRWGLVPALPAGLDLRPDRDLVATAVLVVPVLILLIGALPAHHARDSRPGTAMGMRHGGVSNRRAGRLRRALSALQVAISVAVLAVAGSLVLGARAELSHPLGFRPDGVLLASVDPQLSGYGDDQRRVLYRRAQEILSEFPEVTSVAAAAFVPFAGPRLGANVRYTDASRGEKEINVTGNIVSAGYFGTLGIPILGGRDLPPTEQAGPIPVVVNQTAAKRFWGEASPLGRRLNLGTWLGGEAIVVGEVADLGVGRELFVEPKPSLFLPLWARPWGSATLHVRVGTGEPAALADRVRRAVASVAPEVPVYEVRTMASLVEAARMPTLATAGAVGLMGVLGMLLAAAGIYGVVAQSVADRRHELGVRLAIGARRFRLLRLVLREGLTILVAGTALGIPCALALARLLTSILFAVRPVNALSLGGAILLTTFAMAVALIVPARRAVEMSPVEALRSS